MYRTIKVKTTASFRVQWSEKNVANKRKSRTTTTQNKNAFSLATNSLEDENFEETTQNLLAVKSSTENTFIVIITPPSVFK